MPKRVDLAALARAAFARVDHEAEAAAFYAEDNADREVFPLRFSHLNETGEAVLVFRHLAGTQWLQTPPCVPVPPSRTRGQGTSRAGGSSAESLCRSVGTLCPAPQVPPCVPPVGRAVKTRRRAAPGRRGGGCDVRP